MTKKKFFSERYGYKDPSEVLQFESMNYELRISIWNTIHETFFKDFSGWNEIDRSKEPYSLFFYLWTFFFHMPANEFQNNKNMLVKYIKERYDNFKWYEIYDFLEYLFDFGYSREIERIEIFKHIFNFVLETEGSAYRLINGHITPISNEIEIKEIEEALQISEFNKPIRIQLDNALKKMSAKENPDYRGSIKESISAVETLCQIISSKPKATLSSALDEIEKSKVIKLHQSIRDGFKKLYGWTSDDQGIRHGLKEEPNLKFHDAKYMLITCSAFINYLISKADQAGIDLSKK